METYDLIMLSVAGLAMFFGFIKGFAWQVASLASLVVSYICALRFADQLAPHIHENPQFNKYLAMLVIYIGTSLAIWMLFRMISSSIDRMKLREFDRQMGGLLGLAKGVLLCTVVTFFAVTLTEQTRGAVLRSKSGVYITEFLHAAEPIMPPELKKFLDPKIEMLRKGLDPTQEIEYLKDKAAPEVQKQLQQQVFPQPNYGPGYPQPGYQQPGYTQPGYQQNVPPNYSQPYPNYNGGTGSPPPAGNYVQPGVYAPGQPTPYGNQPYYPAAQPTYQPPR